MSVPTKYVVVAKEGIDTLHRNPGERCNTDDAARKSTIDEATALSMKLRGHVRLCSYCYPPEGEES